MDNENTVEKPQNRLKQLDQHENQPVEQPEHQHAEQLLEDESIIAARERRVAEARKLYS